MPMDRCDSGRWARGNPARPLVWPIFLFLAVVLATPAWAQPEFPSLTGRVVDQAGILRNATERAIRDQLEALEARTTNQVVVVTVRSLQGYSIAEFGRRLGNHWGIGQAGRDNGVLLIVAPNEREVRIEVGRGLESALTVRLAGTIIDSEILPAFRRGRMERGVRAGTDAILAAIDGTYEAPSRSNWSGESVRAVIPFLAVGLFIFVVIMIVRDAFRDGRSRNRVKIGDEYYTMPHTERHRRRDNTWTGGGSSGGGGFSGGGGSFGGGGASGSW